MPQNNKKNGNGRPNNGNGKRRGTTARQNFNTQGNGLSNRGAVRRPMITRKFMESGSDFLASVVVKAAPATAGERILVAQAISPTAFPGTRLSQLSNLWERYRFRRFKLRWVPAVPKTIACQLIVYQDTDPLDDPSVIVNETALVRQATAQAGSQQFNFINATAIELAKRSDDQLYYTGVDKQNERFTRQGNFYVIQVTDPINFNGEPVSADLQAGSLYVDWVCEFQIAQINPSAIVLPTSLALTTAPSSTPFINGTVAAGSITFSEPTYVALRVVDFVGPVSTDISVRLNAGEIGDLIAVSPTRTRTTGLITLFQEGTYDLTLVANAAGTLQSDLALSWINTGGVAPVYNP